MTVALPDTATNPVEPPLMGAPDLDLFAAPQDLDGAARLIGASPRLPEDPDEEPTP